MVDDEPDVDYGIGNDYEPDLDYGKGLETFVDDESRHAFNGGTRHRPGDSTHNTRHARNNFPGHRTSIRNGRHPIEENSASQTSGRRDITPHRRTDSPVHRTPTQNGRLHSDDDIASQPSGRRDSTPHRRHVSPSHRTPTHKGGRFSIDEESIPHQTTGTRDNTPQRRHISPGHRTPTQNEGLHIEEEYVSQTSGTRDITPQRRKDSSTHIISTHNGRLHTEEEPVSHQLSRRRSSNTGLPRPRDWRQEKRPSEARTYPESFQPTDVRDLSKLPVLRADIINSCLRSRFHEDLIYTLCGDILISVNPFKHLDIYNTQVMLVSGESGGGKTEATKLLVQHLVYLAGTGRDALQDKIIQVNPLLENFGNAQSALNSNSSRFAKFLSLRYDENFALHSAHIQDFLLEKSRVVHHQTGETTFHSFYALLAGVDNPRGLYIDRGQTFRITGDFCPTRSRQADSYREMYDRQQEVFSLIGMEQGERENVDVIMAAILHIGEIQFYDDVNDCVTIGNGDTINKVANLLEMNGDDLTTALVERRGKVKGEVIQFSKKRRQADDERDSLAKTLYEKLFGWIVRKVNDSLEQSHDYRPSVQRTIGILDICGFEDLHKNSFEQMCINIINEHLQNFMNRKLIQDEQELYQAEGVTLGVVDTEGVNNDAVLDMFTKRNSILDIIDESSKVEVASDDVTMVRHLNHAFRNVPDLFIPSASNRPEFSIKHFAGKVKYDGRTFIQKNCDSLGEMLEECLKDSRSVLVKELFRVPSSATGSSSRPEPGVPSYKSDIANKKTHIHYFKNSLEELHRNISTATPYFIRCIKPNDSRQPGRYDEHRVLTQLRYNGVTEMARIRSCGLPIRVGKTDFVHRYGDLVKSRDYGDHRIQQILDCVAAQTDSYKIGKTQLFMTSPIQETLEEELADLRRKEQEERMFEEEGRRKGEEVEQLEDENEKLKEVEWKGVTNQKQSSTPSDIDSGVYSPAESGDGSSKSDWYDHFQEIAEEEIREDLSDLQTLKVVKVVLYLFLFIVLLASLVIQKVCFVSMVMAIGKQQDGTQNSALEEKARQAIATVAYIMLIFVMGIPVAVGCMLSLLKLLFSISKAPSLVTWLWVLSTESLHSVGLCLLVFRVMRHMDYFKATYLLCVTASIPSLLKLCVSDREEDPSISKKVQTTSWKVLKAFGIVLDLLAFAVQGSASAAVILLKFYEGYDVNTSTILELVGALVLSSANQWENFSDGTLFGMKPREGSWLRNKILKIRFELQECRSFPNTVAGLIKVGLTILLAYLFADDVSLDFFTAYHKLPHDARVEKWSVVIALILSALAAFITCLMSLKLHMQMFSFALPLCLSTPVTVAVQYFNCKDDLPAFASLTIVGFDHTDECKDGLMITPWYNLPIFAVWLLSLIIVCRHVWNRQMDKDTNMNRLLMNPAYCGVLTTEQIMLNQRRHQSKVEFDFKESDNGRTIKSKWYKIKRPVRQDQAPYYNGMDQDGLPGEYNNNQNGGHDDQPEPERLVTPKIYACATMWHETRTEMVQLLKSLHRLDYDQYLRKISQRSFKYDPNYYEYEAHIFFDDAMEKDDNDFPVPNIWVKELVGAMSEACSSAYGKPMRVHDPWKIVTPYGGQLVWQMPGENLLYVHLKDMDKIRVKKRWSQVMYMYYLLDYRLSKFCTTEALTQLKEKNERSGEIGLNIDDINRLLGEHHAQESEKTFILALDGDTDFIPSSVRILMQRMDNENVGGACGRIHPIGKGPMVWYQTFEYAIGHWLQKAAEHVLGCVLCSPGCFSLFRAKALMDANVVRRYTTEPKQPVQHLQYDQGEDRWLCTLLLQRGFRIEYAAGAEAWTFAPEGFFEFFNQRRRWMPSTIANILDLLSTASRTRERNANFSLIYTMYNWLLIFMTLLGPGTILMMMAGAFQVIFDIQIIWAYFWSIVPAVVFTTCCFWLDTKWQLWISATLSVGYGFIMVIVMVGTTLTATTENVFHPNVIVMLGLVAIFFLTGVFHPKEWACLVHGFLYLLCIPSGYLLLVIYAICNMNNVSWGTREVPTKAQRQATDRAKEEDKLKKKKKGFFKRLFDSGESHILELTNLLRTVMPKNDAANVKDVGPSTLAQDETLVKILSAIEANTRSTQELLEGKKPTKGILLHRSKVKAPVPLPSLKKKTATSEDVSALSTASALPQSQDKETDTDSNSRSMDSFKMQHELEAAMAINPRWTKDDAGLGKGPVMKANKHEIKFWNGLMEKYLQPNRPDAEEKKKIADGLRDLRNSSAFGFILVNLVWMSLNFMFQLTEAAKVHLTYQFGDKEYDVEESVLGMSFVFLLLGLLVIQFAAMVIHRFATLQQLLSTTKIWGEDKDQTGLADQEATLRNLRAVMMEPAPDDEGLQTEPPVPAEEDNTRGVSMQPSRSTAPLPADLIKTVRGYGDLLEKRRKSTLDDTESSFVFGVQKRLGTIRAKHRIGLDPSTRHDLQPQHYPPSAQSRHNHQWPNGAGLRVTKRQLEELSPGLVITESAPSAQASDPRLGVLGKSLKWRASVIHEESTSGQHGTIWGPEANTTRGVQGEEMPRYDNQSNPNTSQLSGGRDYY